MRLGRLADFLSLLYSFDLLENLTYVEKAYNREDLIRAVAWLISFIFEFGLLIDVRRTS